MKVTTQLTSKPLKALYALSVVVIFGSLLTFMFGNQDVFYLKMCLGGVVTYAITKGLIWWNHS